MIDLLFLSQNYLSSLFIGYTVTIILLLIGSSCINFLHNNIKGLLDAFNITASFIAALFVVIQLTELVWHYYNYQADEQAFFLHRLKAYVPTLIFLIGAIILSFSARIRRSIDSTFLLIILFNISWLRKTGGKIIMSFSHDYLPASWSYYVSPWCEYLLFPLLYTIIFMIPALLVFKIRERREYS